MLPLIEVAVLAVMVAAPIVLNGRPELITLITNIVILSLLAISFDLCWGFSGIMTFGQALFFGVPGYVIALVGRDLGLSEIWLTLPLAMVTGLLLAFVVALFLLVGRRPTPIFIALGTLTGSYAAERLVSGWQYVGAGNGLSAVKLLQMGSYEFVEGIEFYSLACVILLTVYVGSRALVRSQLGLVLAGMRQNEERLAFLGYRVQIFKVLVFSLAGTIAGVAGALYSYHQGFIGPGNMGPGLSTQAVIYCLLGGSGTLIGPVIGTGLFLLMKNVVSSYSEHWMLIIGVVFITCVMFFPGGIWGTLQHVRWPNRLVWRPA